LALSGGQNHKPHVPPSLVTSNTSTDHSASTSNHFANHVLHSYINISSIYQVMCSISTSTSLPFIPGEHEYALHRANILAQVSSYIASLVAFDSLNSIKELLDGGRKEGAETQPRVRKEDDRGFRRRYRMSKDAFWTLLDIIEKHLPSTGEKRKRGTVPNGPITKSARLSMALRIFIFAGGDSLDIAEVHGVGDDELLDDVLILKTCHL
jgi:hypothetical protein